jgi:hypothetical protein
MWVCRRYVIYCWVRVTLQECIPHQLQTLFARLSQSKRGNLLLLTMIIDHRMYVSNSM